MSDVAHTFFFFGYFLVCDDDWYSKRREDLENLVVQPVFCTWCYAYYRISLKDPINNVLPSN